MVIRAPIAGERGIEHLAQPMDHHGAPDLPKYPVVHATVIIRSLGDRNQPAARSQNDAASEGLDSVDLRFVSGDHIVERARCAWLQMIGAGTTANHGSGTAHRLGERGS